MKRQLLHFFQGQGINGEKNKDTLQGICLHWPTGEQDEIILKQIKTDSQIAAFQSRLHLVQPFPSSTLSRMLKLQGKSLVGDCNFPINMPKIKVNGRKPGQMLASKEPATFSVVKDEVLSPLDQEPGEAYPLYFIYYSYSALCQRSSPAQ